MVSFIERNLGLILVVVVIIGVMYYGTQGTFDFSNFDFGNLFTINVNPPPAGEAPTQPGSNRVDLCQTFTPAISFWAGHYGVHPSTVCSGGGGRWMCDQDHVGCYDYAAASIDCTAGFYPAVMVACSNYGAYGLCQPTDAYCQNYN